MKKFLIAVLTLFCSFGFIADDAQARRLGGGKSFGMQRSAPAPSRQSAAPAQSPGKPAQQAPAGGNRWLGPIAGLAAGLGLAALFSHLGLGEEMASFVMIALLVMAAIFVLRLLMRRSAPANSPLQFAGPGNAQAATAAFDASVSAGPGGTAGTVLPGFDSATFLREAKLNFLRLQKVNDDGNLDDLREFTTPEVFAELSLQMSERTGAPQHTVIVTLDAELVEVVEERAQYIASVRFSGLIREMSGAAPDHLDEIWHLVKPVDGSRGWAIAGIQQAG